VLPSERRRDEEFAAREAAGESVWTDQFDMRAKVRLSQLVAFFEDDLGRSLAEQTATLLRAWGGWNVGNFDSAVVKADISNDLLIDGLAAIAQAIKFMKSYDDTSAEFQRSANVILREHRISYKFVDDELISFESDELLQEVVEPALQLMAGQRFSAAHKAYMDALKEISNGAPGDAITDAGTALQQTLVALGCEGNALGPLLKDARRRGLLVGHDQNLIDGISKFIDWASADRSTTGDAHKPSHAATSDAWLMVHVVGALIVRLADAVPRGSAE